MGLAVKIRAVRQGLLPSFLGLVAADWSLCVSMWLFFLFCVIFCPLNKTSRFLLFVSVLYRAVVRLY